MNKYIKNIKEYDKDIYKHLKKVLNKKKQIHSYNVYNYLKDIENDAVSKHAALFHDFIEQGGNKKVLNKHLSSNATKLVNILTNKSDNVVKEFKTKTKGLKLEDKTKVFNIKLADRADNFNKRIIKNELTDEYIKKTAKLIQYIYNNYPADKSNIKHFIKTVFTSKSKKLKKLLKL